MTPSPPVGSSRTEHRTEDVAEERARYLAYRRQQAVRLLSLLPDGAVRPLYRRARERSGARGEVDDPMRLLLDFCEEILPLPPFGTWRDDRQANLVAHLDEPSPAPATDQSTGPLTVEVRAFRAAGRAWDAALDIRADGEVWRGHITFRARGALSRPHPTGEIFRESDAGMVRERFLDFDERTLQAFLRSTLP